jgi:L,D-peptidoglycan transpeptidase YkuD (ErfK/YbiS/YcfS/YnhG family)
MKVLTLSAADSFGRIYFGGMMVRCALGRTGCRARKREGDGVTPIGRWHPREVLYRMDRQVRPRTRLPIRPLRPADGWCDAVGDRNYNRQVSHPYPVSAEKLWRSDALYDLIVVLDHNIRPRVQGNGSAVFMHVARTGYEPTAGCIALKRADLMRVMERVNRRTTLHICPAPMKKRPERRLRAP